MYLFRWSRVNAFNLEKFINKNHKEVSFRLFKLHNQNDQKTLIDYKHSPEFDFCQTHNNSFRALKFQYIN